MFGKKSFQLWLLVLLIMMGGGHLTSAGLAPVYTPENATVLVADQDPRDPGGEDRLPLILVHGWMGTSEGVLAAADGTSPEEKAGFYNMMNYIYDGDLKSKFKIFRFHYISDQISDSLIAEGLRIHMEEMIAAGTMADKQIVLIAHSNGGLVSRAYMAEQTHTEGKYAGKKGGERVIRLITLGSPHHGTVVDNGDARVANPADWQIFAATFDATYGNGKAITESNRSDLKWDNYNNLQGYDAPDETNTWLAGLNAAGLYTGKVIAYYASTESPNYTYIELLNYLHLMGGNYSMALLLTSLQLNYLPAFNNQLTAPVFGPYPMDIPFSNGILNAFISASHKHFYNQENDGLISVDSARGENLAFLRTEFFPGLDHTDLRTDHAINPQVFARLAIDLDAAYALREIQAPALVPVVCFIGTLAA